MKTIIKNNTMKTIIKNDKYNKETERLGFEIFLKLKKVFKEVTLYSYYDTDASQDLLVNKVYIPIEANKNALSEYCPQDATNAVLNLLGHSSEVEPYYKTFKSSDNKKDLEFEYTVEVFESGANIELNIFFI